MVRFRFHVIHLFILSGYGSGSVTLKQFNFGLWDVELGSFGKSKPKGLLFLKNKIPILKESMEEKVTLTDHM